MRVFISHSSKDSEVANWFSDLIRTACMNVNVFCSSEKGAIPQSTDYVDYIFSNLNDCTVFIPLITQNYYESRFCMIELGIATSKLMIDYQDRGKGYIFPFSVYPVKKSLALANTPLFRIQSSDLQDEDDVCIFLRDNFTLNLHRDMSSLVKEFESKLNQFMLDNQNIVKNATNVFACFDSSKIDVKDNEDFVRCSVDAKGSITFNYNSNPYEYSNPIKPSFASAVIQYIDGLDLLAYLKNVPRAELYFELLSFTNSIQSISVEIKYGDSHIILMHPFNFEVHNGRQECRVPLFELESEKLKLITEICFVVHASDLVEDEVSFMIENVKIV